MRICNYFEVEDVVSVLYRSRLADVAGRLTSLHSGPFA